MTTDARRRGPFGLAAGAACWLASVTAMAERAPPPAPAAPLFAPFDEAGYSPRLPLPAGWRRVRFEDRQSERWLCWEWSAQNTDCRRAELVFAAWMGPREEDPSLKLWSIGVSVSAHPAPPDRRDRAWAGELKELHAEFTRSAGARGGTKKACAAWRGPAGRAAECSASYGGPEQDPAWRHVRIEERGGWILSVQTGGAGVHPDEQHFAGLRAAFLDGPLGAAGAPMPRGSKAAGTSLVPPAIAKDLPWEFELHDTSTSQPSPGGLIRGYTTETSWTWRSKKPVKGSGVLSFYVSRYDFASAAGARSELDHYLATADHNTGHSYAWDYLAVDGAKLWYVGASCRWSRNNFPKLVANLVREALAGRTLPAGDAVLCTCGSGCDRR